MKKQATLLVFCFLLCLFAKAQALYFPPKTGNTWATVTPNSLGWNTPQISPLLQFLDTHNTKAFLVLKDGKIVIEHYFDTFTQDSLWYWASAGKTVTSFLVGVAQQEGALKITDLTSKYLGKGWTVAPRDKEDRITIWHQLTMTNGLDDNLPPTAAVPEPDNCLKPECLVYKADAGTRWAYHNAPYRLLEEVVPAATGIPWQQYTNQRLKQKIGMSTGFWFNAVFYSKPRDMARFGLLILNKGVWENEAILQDTAYFKQMVNTSQDLNRAYGYLWWLNGKGEYMLPSVQFKFRTDLIPSAPDDLVAALGKNDQKIYVVPSQQLVVIRMGNSAGEGKEALSSFDTQLWEYINRVTGTTTATTKATLVDNKIQVFPNPSCNVLSWQSATTVNRIQLYNAQGKLVKDFKNPSKRLIVEDLPKGHYVVRFWSEEGMQTVRWVKVE
jgi:CubicO group peptidase (beta-lactamase class C family)